jgi:hypothetical protein
MCEQTGCPFTLICLAGGDEKWVGGGLAVSRCKHCGDVFLLGKTNLFGMAATAAGTGMLQSHGYHKINRLPVREVHPDFCNVHKGHWTHDHCETCCNIVPRIAPGPDPIER